MHRRQHDLNVKTPPAGWWRLAEDHAPEHEAHKKKQLVEGEEAQEGAAEVAKPESMDEPKEGGAS